MSVESQYRRFLLLASGGTFLAAAIELFLVEHYADWQQFIPFAMIAAGLGAVVWMWLSPEARAIRVLRWVTVLVVVGSLVGVVLHAKGNAEFALEVTPDEPLASLVWDAVSGVSPLLAPGMLALAAILAAAATYRHPALAE